MKFPLDCKSESHFATSVDCYVLWQYAAALLRFWSTQVHFSKELAAERICSTKKEKQMSSEKWSSLNNEQTKSKFRNTYQIG